MGTVALEEVIEVERAIASEDECRTMPYVGLEDIEKECGRFTDDFRPRPEQVLAAKFRFTLDHVLYGKLRPYLSKVALPHFEGVCTTEILPLRPKRAKLERGFLYAVLLSPRFVSWASQNVSGANLPRLALDRLMEYEFELPNLTEQKRIAAILERADRLRRLRRHGLEMAETVLALAFRKMFVETAQKYPVQTVEDLLFDRQGAIRTGPFGSQLLHSEFTDSGIAVLGIDNVVANRFRWDERRFITAEKYASLKRYTVSPGDVLISIMGTCGRCAIVPNYIPTAINTKHLCCITLDKGKCLPTFLHACFLHHPAVLKRLGVSEKGAIMPGLNMEIIKDVPIPLPPLEAQRQFALIVKRTERFTDIHCELLRQVEHLFQTLLHRAFTAGL